MNTYHPRTFVDELLGDIKECDNNKSSRLKLLARDMSIFPTDISSRRGLRRCDIPTIVRNNDITTNVMSKKSRLKKFIKKFFSDVKNTLLSFIYNKVVIATVGIILFVSGYGIERIFQLAKGFF